MTAERNGGWGGSVPVGTPEKKKKVPLSGTNPEQPSSSSRSTSTREVLGTPSELQDVLTRHHVLLLAPSKQRAAAEALSAAGITAKGLDDLATYTLFRAESETQAIRILATIVQEPTGCALSIKALDGWREEHEARLAREEAEKATRAADEARYPGQAWTRPWHDLEAVDGPQREAWDRNRMCTVAWCLHRAEQKTDAEIAAALGVPESEVASLIERGRVLSQPPDWMPKPRMPDPKEESHSDRIKRFREQMRAARRAQ